MIGSGLEPLDVITNPRTRLECPVGQILMVKNNNTNNNNNPKISVALNEIVVLYTLLAT
jgi:hypothetical protein